MGAASDDHDEVPRRTVPAPRLTPADEDPSRRRFIQVATGALGAGLGIALVAPAARIFMDPTTRKVVTTPDVPIDIGGLDMLATGAPPTQVTVIAPELRDAWVNASNVPLGTAWLRRITDTKVIAYSAVCPHLGCAVGWNGDGKQFICPCHDSRFTVDGTPTHGPCARALDELPVTITPDGRLALTWQRFRLGGTAKVKL